MKITKSTRSPKENEIERAWYLVDVEGLVLGRAASEIAKILKGKHKVMYAPHVDVGDYVIVINASKVMLTGNKLEQKEYIRHSGYPGGLKRTKYGELLKNRPELVVRKAVKGMLPHNRLGRAMFRKLKVYGGPDHPHVAQNPEPMSLTVE